MSSRRKSRPVRRLDPSSEQLLLERTEDVERRGEENGVLETSSISKGKVVNYELRRISTDERNAQENLPEGVVVVQPLSASDDEELVGKSIKKENTDRGFFDVLKKRSMDEEHDERGTEGLDLSLKRRKDDVSDGYQADVQKLMELIAEGQTLQGANPRGVDRKIVFHNNAAGNREKMALVKNRKAAHSSRSSIAALMDSFGSDSKASSAGEFAHNTMPPRQTQSSKAASKSSTNQQRSSDAIDSISAGTVSSGVGSIKKGTLDPTNFDEEVFDQYISKFSLRNPCKHSSCPHFNRDHYHCMDSDCNSQRFTYKADVIRHYNMHKKKDNALAHGFVRFTPNDDCTPHFGPCHLNGTSTHYHCLHNNCTKVYTSTSDVMTHENFHKKNMLVMSVGMRKYRPSELCGSDRCPFRHQPAPHYHCTRVCCDFAAKNKVAIEKHKAFHVRDDAYTRLGFKKVYKNEMCDFPSCPWNRSTNHFHCLRKNCAFSFASTNRMVAHKRKHDQQEGAPSMANMQASALSAFNPPKAGSMNTTSASELASLQARSKLNVDLKRVNLAAAYNRISPVTATSSALPRTDALEVRHSSPYADGATGMISRNVTKPRDNSAISQVMERISNTVRREQASPPSTVEQRHPCVSLQRNGSPLTAIASETQAAIKPRGAVEKFFQSVSAHSCSILDCVFYSRPHHHCVVQGCCAVFTDQSLVAIHGSFHEKLVQAGIEQMNSSLFPALASPPSQETTSATSQPLPSEFLALPSVLALERYQKVPSPLGTVRDTNASDSFRTIGSARDTNTSDSFRTIGSARDTNISDSFRTIGSAQDTNTSDSFRTIGSARDTNISDSFRTIGSAWDPNNSDSFRTIGSARDPNNSDSFRTIGSTRDPNNSDSFRTIGSARDSNNSDSFRTIADETDRSSKIPKTPSILTSTAFVRTSSTAPTGGVVSSVLAAAKQSELTSSRSHSASRRFTSRASVAPTSSQILTRSQKQATAARDGSSNDGYKHFKAGAECICVKCKYKLQEHWHCTLNWCKYICKSLGRAQSHRQFHDNLETYSVAAKKYCRSYSVKRTCPYPNCEYRQRGHYHCLKPRCKFVTVGTSKLPWHMKRHEKIERREANGFKHYIKEDKCGQTGCKLSGTFAHYHCIQPGCAFAFQYKHQMATHVRKHLKRAWGSRRSSTVSAAPSLNGAKEKTANSARELVLLALNAKVIKEENLEALFTNQEDHPKEMDAGGPVYESKSQQQGMLNQVSRGAAPKLHGVKQEQTNFEQEFLSPRMNANTVQEKKTETSLISQEDHHPEDEDASELMDEINSHQQGMLDETSTGAAPNFREVKQEKPDCAEELFLPTTNVKKDVKCEEDHPDEEDAGGPKDESTFQQQEMLNQVPSESAAPSLLSVKQEKLDSAAEVFLPLTASVMKEENLELSTNEEDHLDEEDASESMDEPNSQLQGMLNQVPKGLKETSNLNHSVEAKSNGLMMSSSPSAANLNSSAST